MNKKGFLLIGFVFVFLSSSATFAAKQCEPANTRGGDFLPWPYGQELSFPWTEIRGTWQPETTDCDSLFIFRVAANTGAEPRVVRITEYDPISCEVLARGVGFVNDQVLQASMVTTAGSRAFDLTVRSFDPKSLGEITVINPLVSQQIVLVSVFPTDNWEQRKSYPMRKIAKTVRMRCTN